MRRAGRSGWREGGWPKETRNSGTGTGHSSGYACNSRWSGYDKQLCGTRRRSSRPCGNHVYDVDRLCESYFNLKKDAAAGIDGETWKSYGANLEENLRDLAERLRHGSYRAAAVRRTYIPKADGRQRPIGIPTLEDKIAQRAAAEVIGTVCGV